MGDAHTHRVGLTRTAGVGPHRSLVEREGPLVVLLAKREARLAQHGRDVVRVLSVRGHTHTTPLEESMLATAVATPAHCSHTIRPLHGTYHNTLCVALTNYKTLDTDIYSNT